ncbi:SH3 domain-containing protein [Exiguobacterium sp. SL14]|nr:SH3 domain-containing protein [Exiguobacterium sp. SL14]MCY1690099.1 SH3 domain-containing protein [Exiguobacterium sp. SL14]
MSVALRASASTLSGQVARLGRGTPVAVTNSRHQTKGFVAVRTASGQSGYVDATYLTLFQPSTIESPITRPRPRSWWIRCGCSSLRRR